MIVFLTFGMVVDDDQFSDVTNKLNSNNNNV